MSILRGFVLIGLSVIALGACASGGTQSGDVSGQQITITVENTAVPPTTLTVWMVKDNGMQQRLGTVSSNNTATFNYTVPGVGQYRLEGRARTASGSESQFFTVTDSHSRIIWDIGANSVVVR